MKILFFHRWSGVHLGGTETHVRELAEHFVARGHEVSILTRQGDGLSGLEQNIRVYRVSRNPFESNHSYENSLLLYLHTALFMLKAFLYLGFLYWYRGQRFDVISVHFYTEAVVARLFRLLTGTPYVFVLEGYTRLEAEEAKKADLCIAISHHEVDETFRHHGYRPLYIPKGKNPIFNPLADGGEIRNKYLGQAEKILIAVGRIESRKDYPTLVKSAKILKNMGKKYRWLIAGDGIDFQKIAGLIREEHLTEDVIMLGPVKNEELPAYYRASDLFVLPTTYEGFGYVYIEAMGCGLPIVSTVTGAVPEVVDGAGELVSPKHPEAFARAIVGVLEDPQKYRQFKEAALKTSGKYLWENLILEYEKAFQSVFLKSKNKNNL